MKIVQKNWRQLTEEQKEGYKEQSKVNRSEYEQKRRQYDQSKGNEQVDSFIVTQSIQKRR